MSKGTDKEQRKREGAMKSKLTKVEIIENIHEKLGLTRTSIHKIVDGTLIEIKEGLSKGQTLELRGFGTFYVKQREGKAEVRNPKTGKLSSIDRHCVALFRPGKDLKAGLYELRSPEET